MDNYAKCKICICFLGVDKWRNQKNSKQIFTITPEAQKHSALHLSTIPPNLLFYTVLKHQIQPSPLYRPNQIYSHRSPAASPDRLAGSGGIPPFYRRGGQQNNEIAARIGGIAKTTSYLTISKNHIATSPPHPPQNPLPHHTLIRNPPILHTPPLSRQTNHFEKTKKSRL